MQVKVVPFYLSCLSVYVYLWFSVFVLFDTLPLGGASWCMLFVCSCSFSGSVSFGVYVFVSVGVLVWFLLLCNLGIWLVYWVILL